MRTLLAVILGIVSVSALDACTSSGIEDNTALGTIACNDGTGLADCCPSGVAAGKACSHQLSCWTPCTNGSRFQLACADAKWVAGKGSHACGPSCQTGGCADASADVTVACDDGTGGDDCCDSSVQGGGACTTEGSTCWTNCTGGIRFQFACSGGLWVAGKGGHTCVDSGEG
ncbi:MAG: hypothetical protein IPI67_20275 [Myxococcales bacterium]|nr:hypothetical protein [Myxococcales bacterium]